MWMLVPILCLVIVHISGNNIGVIPDLAGAVTRNAYIATVLTSVIVGIVYVAMITWIGIRTRLDVVALTKSLYGPFGRKIVAILLLSISIPASALTGAYYAGEIVHVWIGVPYWFASLSCLIFFSLLSMSYHRELLVLSNYIALLLIPILSIVFFYHDFHYEAVTLAWSDINWLLVLGLTAYNGGGMWSVFGMETATYLSYRGNQAVVLVVLAKVVEGILTLSMAALVLSAGTHGPLAVVGVVQDVGGVMMIHLLYISLFCAFTNTMAPAMLVNARQMSRLTGLSVYPALLISTLIIYAVSFIDFRWILSILAYTGLFMILFIIYIAYFLHKHGINKQ